MPATNFDAANFDRLKLRHMVSEYGHAEFMLGLEGISPDRGQWSRKAIECEKALCEYVESHIAALNVTAGRAE